MEETRVFTGSMDLNSAPENIAPGDFGRAYNIRNKTTEGEDYGYLSFWNNFVRDDSTNLPAGSNKSLFSYNSTVLNAVFDLKYNSEGRHTLVKYIENSSQVLFTNLIDTSADLFNWTADTFVNDMILHQERWLLITDGSNEVFCFDIKKLQEGYGRPIQLLDIRLAKNSPLLSPNVRYIATDQFVGNIISDKIFQFKYKYVYPGGMDTAWSPGSRKVVPRSLNGFQEELGAQPDNVLWVDMRLDNESIESIVVAFSYDGGEWAITREVPVSYIKSLPAERPIGNTLSEAYNPTSRMFSMTFTDPYSISLITVDEADHNYESVPRSAKSLDMVNNNVLLLAGLKEGYPEVNNLNSNLSLLTQSAGITGEVVGRGTLKIVRVDRQISYDGSKYTEFNYIQLGGVPLPGDVISIVLNYGYLGVPNSSATPESAEIFTYTVTSSDTNLTTLYANWVAGLPAGQVFTDSGGTYIGWHFPYEDYQTNPNRRTMLNVDIDLIEPGYVNSLTFNSFKKGSSVQFALSYKDEVGRYFPLATDESFKVSFPHPSVNVLSFYDVQWQINHNPPIGAKSYQWMVSEDLKHQSYVDLMAEYNRGLTRQGKYIVLDLYTLNRFVNNSQSGVNYSFTKGDRIYFISSWFESSNIESSLSEYKWDLEVVDFKVQPISELESGYHVYVEYSQSLFDYIRSFSDSGNAQLKVQLYTPKIVTASQDELLFREVGPSYAIENAQHSVTSGTLRGIDDFTRGRVFERSVNNANATAYKAFMVESRNKTDTTSLVVPFRGNVRSLNDQIINRETRASIRFSDVANVNVKYSGLNKFFEGRIYGEGPGETTSKNGAITKIHVSGNYLKVLQEDEVALVPVFLSMVQDNDGNIQTADSSRILNTCRYIGEGKAGTGKDAKSFSVNSRGVVYFFDNTRKIPYLFRGLSLVDISGKMSSYFSTQIQSTFRGHSLDLYKEYWLCFQDTSGQQYTVIYDEVNNGWYTFSDNIPETMINLSETYTFKGGVRYKMDRLNSGNSFYGSVFNASIDAPFSGGYVRNFKSIGVHSESKPETSVAGIRTALKHTSDLTNKNFSWREGVWTANFLRDIATGLFNGKILKGRWIMTNLVFKPEGYPLDLFKVVVKSQPSSPSE